MAVQMTRMEEKVWEYLLTHRAPVSIEKLSKHFIISKSHTSTILKKFADQGIADVVKVGNNKFYKVKE